MYEGLLVWVARDVVEVVLTPPEVLDSELRLVGADGVAPRAGPPVGALLLARRYARRGRQVCGGTKGLGTGEIREDFELISIFL